MCAVHLRSPSMPSTLLCRGGSSASRAAGSASCAACSLSDIYVRPAGSCHPVPLSSVSVHLWPASAGPWRGFLPPLLRPPTSSFIWSSGAVGSASSHVGRRLVIVAVHAACLIGAITFRRACAGVVYGALSICTCSAAIWRMPLASTASVVSRVLSVHTFAGTGSCSRYASLYSACTCLCRTLLLPPYSRRRPAALMTAVQSRLSTSVMCSTPRSSSGSKIFCVAAFASCVPDAARTASTTLRRSVLSSLTVSPVLFLTSCRFESSNALNCRMRR